MARWLPSLFVRSPHTGSLSAAATPSSSTESSTAPTQDADVFSDKQGGVEAAADAVEAALLDAGFGTERRDKTGGLRDIFTGWAKAWLSGLSPARRGTDDAEDGLF